jgi:hypothetical protein
MIEADRAAAVAVGTAAESPGKTSPRGGATTMVRRHRPLDWAPCAPSAVEEKRRNSMIYGRSTAAPRRTKKELIVGVGWHAHIHWSQPVGKPPCSVPTADNSGQMIENDLADGDEVEILSWRQRSRAGVAYQIRRLSDGSECWIDASYLRRARVRADQPLESRP